MGWLEDMLPFQVPNAAGDARRDMEPQVASYRGDNGRFDPTALTQGMPPEVQSNADMIMRVGEARRQAQEGNRPEPLSWNKWLGGALQEISVPVAYAQGNRAYGAQMMPNTILKQDLARRSGYEDERRSALSRINDDTAVGVGNAVMDYNKSKLERRRAAKEMVAKSIFAAGMQGPDAEAEAALRGAQYLRSLGLNEDADAVARRAPSQPPSVTAGPAMAPPEGGVPGTVVTPPSMPGAPAPQAQGMPQAGGPPSAGVPLSPKRQQAEIGRPILGDDWANARNKEAEIEEAPGLEGAKQAAKEYATAQQARQTKIDNANVMAPKVGQLFDQLDTYGDVKGLENYTGAIEGSMAAPYTTDLINGLRPGNQATPALRDQIRGTQMALVALLKGHIRTPGEGSQDQREFQAVIDTIGDMTNANTIEDYHAKLLDSKKRVEMLTGTPIPTQRQRLSTQSDADMGAGDQPDPGAPPARTSVPAASMPIGAERTKIIDGAPVTFVKTPNGWVEKTAPAPDQRSVPMNRAGPGRPLGGM